LHRAELPQYRKAKRRKWVRSLSDEYPEVSRLHRLLKVLPRLAKKEPKELTLLLSEEWSKVKSLSELNDEGEKQIFSGEG
jgi:hypothetical protein